jgi:hypothetical protein
MKRIVFDAKQIAELQKSKHYDAVMAAENHLIRVDAGAIYSTNQLVYLETRVREKVEADLTALSVFPVNFEGHPGIDAIRVESGESKGVGKQIGNSGKDFERVELDGDDDLYPAINYGLEYAVNIDELAAAEYAGRNVSTKKADACSRGMDKGINNCLWLGDGKLPGLMKANIRNSLTNYTGFSNKIRNLGVSDAKNFIKLMKAQANAVYGGRWPVNTFLVCPEDYEFITTTELSDSKDKVLVQFLMEIGLKNIVSCPELKGMFDSGTKDGMIMFPRDPEIIEASMPGGLKRALPAHFNGWEFITKYIAKCSGVHVHHPKKISWAKA